MCVCFFLCGLFTHGRRPHCPVTIRPCHQAGGGGEGDCQQPQAPGRLSSHRFSYSQMSAITTPHTLTHKSTSSCLLHPQQYPFSALCPEVFQCRCLPPISLLVCEYVCAAVVVYVRVCWYARRGHVGPMPIFYQWVFGSHGEGGMSVIQRTNLTRLSCLWHTLMSYRVTR